MIVMVVREENRGPQFGNMKNMLDTSIESGAAGRDSGPFWLRRGGSG